MQYFPESCIYIYEYTKENFIHNLLIPRLNLYFSMGSFPNKGSACESGAFILLSIPFIYNAFQSVRPRSGRPIPLPWQNFGTLPASFSSATVQFYKPIGFAYLESIAKASCNTFKASSLRPTRILTTASSAR